MDQYWTIPDNKVADIKAFDFSEAATRQELARLAQSLTNPGAGPWPQIIAPLDASGAVTIGRSSRFQIVRLDTFGQAATDAITALNVPTPDPFQDFDMVYLVAENEGRAIVVNSPTNVAGMPASITIAAGGDYVALMRKGGQWHYQHSLPKPAMGNVDTLTFAELSTSVYVDVFGNASINLSKSLGSVVSRKTGETAATGTIQVTAAGPSGYVRAVVTQDGSIFTIGLYTYSGSPTVNAVAAGLSANIEARKVAGEHGYAAVVSTDTVTVSVPAGYGASGNAFTLEGFPSGGTAATVVSFGGGVDGAFQDETIDALYGGVEGQLHLVRNAMPANTITIPTAAGVSQLVTLAAGKCVILLYLGSTYHVFSTT